MDAEGVIRQAARRLGSEKDARIALEGLQECVLEELSEGGSVDLRGFGRFDLSPTGQPRFRPAGVFRDEVASGRERTGTEDSMPLRFRRFTTPEGVSLSAILPLALDDRCGIYVLHFEDGTCYVGQATDVLRRFASHRRHWATPIVELDFATVPHVDLDRMERETIQHLERQGTSLMNSALVGLPMGPAALDVVIERVQQEEWLIEGEQEYDIAERHELAVRRRKRPKGDTYRALSSRPDFEALRTVLACYMAFALPWPHLTEQRFWAVTSLPSTNKSRTHHRLSAFTVNNVETLVLFENLEDDIWYLEGFLNLAPTDRWTEDDPVHRHPSRTVGPVDSYYFFGYQQLWDLLDAPEVLGPAQRLVLGLMRKGNGMMSRFHDTALADSLFMRWGELTQEADL